MSTVHIEARIGDIADVVIMPGDPKRCKYIAENYLEDYKLINTIREEFGYTGFYKGRKITIFSSGMGIPSMGIYSYELFKYYGVKNIIRIGTAGSYDKNIHVNDIILATSSHTDSNYALSSFGRSYKDIASSKELNELVKEASKELQIKIKPKDIITSEVFYTTEINREGIVEMESFSLFTNAKELGCNATTILTISDSYYEEEMLSSEERERNLNNMIVLALNTSLKL